MELQILRLPQVVQATGLARSTVYLRIGQGLLPKPISLGGKAVGWPLDDIIKITNARIAGFSDQEITELVKKIELERKTFKEIF